MLSIVVVVAALLRIAFVTGADVQSPLRVDAGQYAQYATNLVEHGVYSLSSDPEPLPDSFRSPGYPVFLAFCRALGGENFWYEVARWLQVGLSTLTVLLIYGLARQLFSFATAVVAALLVALSPHLVVAPAYILTECLASFVVTLALWSLLGSRGTAGKVVGAAVLGLAPLCNEALVFLPVVVAATMWRRDRRMATTVFMVAMLPFACWSIRNQVTDLALSGSQRAVASISHGSYPGMVYESRRYFGFPYREDPEQPEFGASWSNLWSVWSSRVGREPLRYAKWYLIDKPIWLWSWPLVQGNDVYVYPVGNSPYERQPVMSATHWFMKWVHLPLMWLACLGAFVGIGRRGSDRSLAPQVLGWVAVVGTLAYLPVIPDPRYLQPIRPLLFLLAAAAVPMLSLAFRERDVTQSRAVT